MKNLPGESEDSSPPVPNVDEEAVWEDDDVEAMKNAAKMLTQLSFSSRMIIRASISQAYQIEKDAGTLRKGYDVIVTGYDESLDGWLEQEDIETDCDLQV